MDERGPWVTDDKWSRKGEKIDACRQEVHDYATEILCNCILRVRSQQSESILILDCGKSRLQKPKDMPRFCRNKHTKADRDFHKDVH
jgi:hypothetical protein